MLQATNYRKRKPSWMCSTVMGEAPAAPAARATVPRRGPSALALLGLLALLGTAASSMDHPIASGALPFVLDDASWTVTRTGGAGPSLSSLPAQVPGDILSDLQRAGRAPDPYFNLTWREPEFVALWNTGTWTYRRRFTTPASAASAKQLLVFNGIRMGAVVTLNGHWLFNATNQFQRYSVPLDRAWLKTDGGTLNELAVAFGSELGIDCGGRFTLSSQIDWAPRMVTNDSFTGRSTFGFAIWRSVYLLPVPDAAITQLVPHTFYAGDHPTALLEDNNHAGFKVVVRCEIFAPSQGVAGHVSVLGSWAGAVAVDSQPVTLEQGVNNLTLELPPEQTRGARLWHVSGYGDQVRYNLSATFIPARVGAANVSASRLIGFRHLALVTVNDTDNKVIEAAATANGTGQFTMFFRCNGAAIYSRGANKIPMELLEGRMSDAAHRRLVQSAAEGRMNTLRVWGGAIWEPESFYDAADEFGLLIYHDAQFLNGGLEPYGTDGPGVRGTASERDELEYQLARLSHHPSIAMWDGCNECGGGGIYDSFVMTTIATVDKSRPIWPSCPAPGWISGVDRLTCRPNGEQLVTGPGPGGPRPDVPSFPQESHGPYTAFLKQISDNVMPIASAVAVATGPGEPGWFRSEFGATSWSSFEMMTGQMPRSQWSVDSPAAGEVVGKPVGKPGAPPGARGWNVSNMVLAFFGDQCVLDMERSGEESFKRQIYRSMIAQGLFLKAEIESWRAQNVWGSLIWMFNEIWAAGAGWGSIEYSSGPGSVEGGRWKPLHYMLRSSVYADQMCSCTVAGQCFVTNDGPRQFEGTVSIKLFNVMDGAHSESTRRISLAPGAIGNRLSWWCGTASNTSADDHIPIASSGSGKLSYTRHELQLPTPRDNFTAQKSLDELQCEAACNAEPSCLGFTTVHNDTTSHLCWLYSSAPKLISGLADWWQRPGTAPIPVAPPAPAPLACIPWASSPAWSDARCDALGSNCVLSIVVTDAAGNEASNNIVPFVAPKAMTLQSHALHLTVGPIANGEVEIGVLCEYSAALYVVLTTRATGRFSKNAFLLEEGEMTVTFIPWGTLNETSWQLLNSSLRVEHLADAMDPHPSAKK